MKFLLPLLLLSLGAFSGPISQEPQQNADFHVQNAINRSVESDDFLTYWKEDFRKNEQGEIVAICDITYSSYKEMYERYIALSQEDREVINATSDYEEGYKIADSIKQLISMFSSTPKQNERMVLDQKTTIIIVVSVAVFGMSAICVFFVFKNNKFIG